MAALPYMQLYVAGYLADTTHLDVIESGAYLHLLMNYWQTGKPLPNDDSRLARIAKCTPDQFLDIKNTLCEFFEITPHAWMHKRCERDLKKVKLKSKKHQNAANARWNKKKTHNANAYANAQQTQCHTDTDTDTDTDKRKKRACARAFDEWYKIYPHKIGKAAAKTAFSKAIGKADFDELKIGLQRYIETKPPDRPWCNPATWLNQERWTDQPATEGDGNDKPRKRSREELIAGLQS